MKFYLVGGCVRDEILGREHQDRDYVVVGARPEQLLQLGFQKVGRDFPVFLHPTTGEEYALARKERMTQEHNFDYEWDAVTLEQDLYRRDLTINAIAKDLESGHYIDPFGGIQDIENQIIRHISSHFAEDPLRVLRVARLKSQLPNFQIAKETKELCMEISKEFNLMQLSGERIWAEMIKALQTPDPRPFFEFLLEVGALEKFFPELARLYGVPQKEKYHPEGHAWIHTMLVLKAACDLSDDIGVRFSALVHDLGKGITPEEILPSHHHHESTGIPLVQEVCQRFRVPNKISRLASKVTKYHLQVHRSLEMRPAKVVKLLKHLEAIRHPEFFENALLVCTADDMGKLSKDYIPAAYLRFMAGHLRTLDYHQIIADKAPEKIPELITRAQIQCIKLATKSWSSLQMNQERAQQGK